MQTVGEIYDEKCSLCPVSCPNPLTLVHWYWLRLFAIHKLEGYPIVRPILGDFVATLAGTICEFQRRNALENSEAL